MAYEQFEKGGKKFYRYGTWEIEADLARRTRRGVAPTRDQDGNPIDPSTLPGYAPGDENTASGQATYEEEDSQATEQELARIARERSVDAASAQALGLTTGAQSGFLGGTRRVGKTIDTGGRFAGSRMLTQGRNAARLLGGGA